MAVYNICINLKLLGEGTSASVTIIILIQLPWRRMYGAAHFDALWLRCVQPVKSYGLSKNKFGQHTEGYEFNLESSILRYRHSLIGCFICLFFAECFSRWKKLISIGAFQTRFRYSLKHMHNPILRVYRYRWHSLHTTFVIFVWDRYEMDLISLGGIPTIYIVEIE